MTQLRPTYTITRDPADQRRRAQAQTLAALKACAILHGYIVGLQRVADDATAHLDTLAAIEAEMAALAQCLAALMVDLPQAGRMGE